MSTASESDRIFARLRAILSASAAGLITVRDVPGDYCVDTPHVMKNGKRLFFGAVRTGKSYVSYHLMPVYVYPVLVDEISPQLKRRMHGKSCFNFKQVDEALFGQLARLTDRGLREYRQAGYLGEAAGRQR